MIAPAILLSSQTLLNSYLQRGWPDESDLQQQMFNSLRSQHPFQPDYAIESLIEEANLKDITDSTSEKYAELILRSFSFLAKPLFSRGKEIYIRQEQFEAWQQSLAYVMPLPIIAFYASQNLTEQEAKQSFYLWFKQQSCLPRPYIPELNNLLTEGLSEHHLHIMGTTESDYVWLDALRHPKAVIDSLAKAFKHPEARQQLKQLNKQVSFSDIYRLLRLASVLRSSLLDIIQGRPHSNLALMNTLSQWPGRFLSTHPAVNYAGSNNPLIQEATLLYGVFCYLQYSKNEVAARYLHVYLLIQALFHRMLSQQLINKGFQQFEKITINELRETTEKRFEQRFKQVKGMYNTPVSLLEARFAPKEDINKLRALLKAILKGYDKEAEQQLMPLSLTAHFIKKSDSKPSKLHPCRHYLLRKSLAKQKKVLTHYLKKNNEAKSKVIAIDAAGNELNAEPDVFAPLYRQLRKEGFKHFTYHAGEDFKHILSGIRQVYEAVVFLDLHPGDRIGHATALGIAPNLWLQRSAKKQTVTQGEWFSTLLFTHHILSKIGSVESNRYAYLLEEEIFKLSEEIFQKVGFTLQTLKSSWLERWRDPLCNNNDLANLPKSTAYLFKEWHRADVYERARKTIEINPQILPEKIYYEMQEFMLGFLCDKQIAIEILPTSNLRISYYQTYDEHHVHRWLEPTAKNRPVVLMGSDDPGIFSTNLFNEYSHIYISAKNKKTTRNSSAINLIKEISENGKNYGFWLEQP